MPGMVHALGYGSAGGTQVVTQQADAKWHGSREQGSELVRAILANCDPEDGGCKYTDATKMQIAYVCPSHRGLEQDQRWLDGLYFVKQYIEKYRAQEWSKKRSSRGVD